LEWEEMGIDEQKDNNRYRIVCDTDPNNVAKRVDQLLELSFGRDHPNWEVHGDLVVTERGGELFYTQAVVRRYLS
jgi:hypothetical protein